MEEQVIKTKKGLFIRRDKDFGAIVFSPYSGLFFAVAKDYVEETLKYCNNKENTLQELIKDNLSIGINNLAQTDFIIDSHLLPSPKDFSYTNNILPNEYPIVINWLISNKCSFSCNYCYAADVLNKTFADVDVEKIANQILTLNPLAVVLSGGEPLLEKTKILTAIKTLGNKTGIILDTNGFNYDKELTKLFKQYNVVVRISLDATKQEITDKIRPLKNNNDNISTLYPVFKNINQYKENRIPILIHTVVTSINKNSLDELYATLCTLGVNGWRIFSVVNPNDKEKQKSFKKLMTFGKAKDIKEANKEIEKDILFFKKRHRSKSTFSIQILQSNESKKNSVILVLPNGKFATESMFEQDKIEIQESIFRQVDLKGHYERYLGKI